MVLLQSEFILLLLVFKVFEVVVGLGLCVLHVVVIELLLIIVEFERLGSVLLFVTAFV